MIGGGNEGSFGDEFEKELGMLLRDQRRREVDDPRLPPPLLSKEDWRLSQRLKGGASAIGGIRDKRKVNGADENGGRAMFNNRKKLHVIE